MLGIATVATMATSPGQTFLVSQFYNDFQTHLGLDSTAPLAMAYMFGTLGAGMLMPLAGRLSDQFGTRIMMGSAVTLLGITCFFIGHVSSIYELGVAFFCLRTFGQGTLSLVAGHTVALWFEARLGVAESVRHTGFSVAKVIMPPVAAWLILTWGWEQGYMYLGVGVMVAVIPLVLFLFKRTPESMGQFIDNQPKVASPDSPKQELTLLGEVAFTAEEAMQTRAYWIITAGLVANAAIYTAIALEHQEIVEQAGHSRQIATSLLPVSGAVSLVAVPVSGWLVDRYAEAKLMAASSLMLGIATACVAFAESLPLLYTAMVFMGMTMSLIFVLSSPILARYFGRPHHGAIRGTLTRSMILGTAIAPFLLSQSAVWSGGYQKPLLVIALLTIPLAMAGLSIKPPQHP